LEFWLQAGVVLTKTPPAFFRLYNAPRPTGTGACTGAHRSNVDVSGDQRSGIDTEALRKAALDTDIPIGGTIQGYGVKFFPPGHQMPGQSERSSPVVMQYIGKDTKIVWPTAIKTADPVLPLQKSHT